MVLAVLADPARAFIELGAIVLGLSLLARGAGRFGVSPIPLYLLGGLLVGIGGVIPTAVTEEFVEVAAEIGVLLLLFTLGLEYTPRELSVELRRNYLGGLVDLAANFVPGLVAGLMLGWDPVAAVLLGDSVGEARNCICRLLWSLDLGRMAGIQDQVGAGSRDGGVGT